MQGDKEALASELRLLTTELTEYTELHGTKWKEPMKRRSYWTAEASGRDTGYITNNVVVREDSVFIYNNL